MSNDPGQSLGTAGGSLGAGGSWARNDAAVKAGLQGERRTAAILDALAQAPGGPTVLHDLRIPMRGVKANIDHVVISGRRITIIDTKVWKPGVYWTLFGRTYRGRERFSPADKRTLPMARDAISDYLRASSVSAHIAKPLLVIWPSHPHADLGLRFLRSPGATAIAGATLAAEPVLRLGSRTADPAAVRSLQQLLIRS